MKTIILSVLLMATGLGCAVARPAISHRAFSDDLEAAKRLIESGNRRQALDELSMLLDMDPRNEEARLLRAVAYQGLDEFPLAIQDYEAVLQRNPSSLKAHYNLGMIYAFKLNDREKALRHFDRFLSQDPSHPKSFTVAKIMCSVDEGRSERSPEIQEELDRVTQFSDPRERREKLLALSRKAPGSPVPLFLIAKTYEYEGNSREAEKYYQLSLEVRPTCVPCHQAFGRLLLKKKKRGEAEIHLAKAKLFDPNSQQVSEESGDF